MNKKLDCSREELMRPNLKHRRIRNRENLISVCTKLVNNLNINDCMSKIQELFKDINRHRRG